MTHHLAIKGLTLESQSPLHPKQTLIKQLSTQFNQGKITGIVGESGSGKTLLMKSVMQLLPEEIQVTEGSITWDGNELGKRSQLPFAMIFQDPLASLNPLRTIYYHLNEVIVRFHHKNKDQRHDLMVDYLNKVGISNADQVLKLYPHELSGGMIQRIMICMALLKQPQILIADEPTTALDVTTQKQILDILSQLNREEGLTIIFVSHDLAVIRDLCDEVKVMYAGKLVEEAPVVDLFERPGHRYTQELIQSIPAGRHKERLHEMRHIELSDQEWSNNQLVEIAPNHRVLGGLQS